MALDLEVGNIGERAGAIGGTILQWILIIGGGLLVLGIFGGIAMWAMKRKKWNLIVEIKMPRNDGQVILRERAKGYFDAKAGVVDIKRKGLRAVGMKPFDVKKYLQGNKYLEVIQISPNEYIPVLPKSYTTVSIKEEFVAKVKEGKGKDGKDKFVDKIFTRVVESAIMKIEADFGKRKTWKTYMERAAKNRFTIIGFLDKHWRAIEMSIIIFVIFLGLAILWMRMPSICG